MRNEKNKLKSVVDQSDIRIIAIHNEILKPEFRKDQKQYNVLYHFISFIGRHRVYSNIQANILVRKFSQICENIKKISIIHDQTENTLWACDFTGDTLFNTIILCSYTCTCGVMKCVCIWYIPNTYIILYSNYYSIYIKHIILFNPL